MDVLKQLAYIIIGAVLTPIATKIYNSYFARKFKKIFGKDIKSSFFIVYGLNELTPTLKTIEWPYIKPGVEGKFRFLSPVSAAQLRAVNYISESYVTNTKAAPTLATDLDINNRLDISFCAVGGRNNLKTIEIENHIENKFFKFDLSNGGAIVSINENGIKFKTDGIYDYGFIIKLRPKTLPDRTWIGIAGLGEWGTSGAAWFLSKNWKYIEKMYGEKPFGLIIKVRGGKDESAEMVHRSQ